MPSALVADTHAAIWYILDDPRLSANARNEMESAAQPGLPIYVPSITLVEIVYLVEKGRFTEELIRRLLEALRNPNNVLCLAPLDLSIAQALRQVPREQVPDMPDRIVAATALALELPLITRDGKIIASQVKTIW